VIFVILVASRPLLFGAAARETQKKISNYRANFSGFSLVFSGHNGLFSSHYCEK